jgi:hypothetical protein
MRLLSVPNYKFSKNVCLQKNPFGSSADHDVANKPYRINVCVCVCTCVCVCVCVYIYDDQWACSCLVQIMSCYSLLY